MRIKIQKENFLRIALSAGVLERGGSGTFLSRNNGCCLEGAEKNPVCEVAESPHRLDHGAAQKV